MINDMIRPLSCLLVMIQIMIETSAFSVITTYSPCICTDIYLIALPVITQGFYIIMQNGIFFR